MTRTDDICPREVKEKRITLALDPSTPTPRTFAHVLISIDYSKCAPAGVSLPLVLEVQGPSPSSYVRREFTRLRPVSLVVVPREGGSHLVTLREAAHNRWWGSLRIEVVGTPATPKRFA